MAQRNRRRQSMNAQDFFAWRSSTSTAMTATGDDDIVADMDEPPDHHIIQNVAPEFHKSVIRPQGDRKESLLTRAFHTGPGPEIFVATDMDRRRSMISNTSAASTADLTSDGGITSPARTDTPSPPFPSATYMKLAPFALGTKQSQSALPIVKQDFQDAVIHPPLSSIAVPKPDPAVEALVKKRCISFACGGQKPRQPIHVAARIANSPPVSDIPKEVVAPKRCTIKFACGAPKPAEKLQTKPDNVKETHNTIEVKIASPSKAASSLRQHTNRSPSMTRKLRSTPPPISKTHRDSTSTVRRASQSPAAVRHRKPTYIVADEEAMKSSESTRFPEFAREEVQEDDWIRKDVSETREKLTINDTLKKENAIRQLGKEVEDEALQEEDENEDEDDEDGDDQDDDNTLNGSEDEEASDGNETDNEAGFADSDDESDAVGDFQFWTPGKSIFSSGAGEASTFRGTAHRTASESSIDSLKHMSPLGGTSRKHRTSRRIRIRPGTPDLPDSTDFVCGTLDEDRPLEDAYVSCLEARKRSKHHIIPQDIDPSFPTSDPENEEDDDAVDAGHDSEEIEWLHGKFEDSDDGSTRNHRRMSRKSPAGSPKRLHSPPPPRRHPSPAPIKNRHRSPPPRRLFGGHSPKRMHSPPPAQTVRSPPASPTNVGGGAISFAPLGQRPGLTHTKSLPRRPNGFGQYYRASRLASIAGIEGSDNTDGHTRGAIDIVKGLESKRLRRKEKFYQKHCNRARKAQPERRPQPGKGAERMRELGLQMAGKVEHRTGKAEFVLSI